MNLPPLVNVDDRIILFDGVCKLCNSWSKFIIKHDTKRLFKLSSVQSKEGQAILNHFGLPTDHFETMLYVEGDRCFEKSEAAFEIISKLGFPWSIVSIFRIVPRGLSNWLYDRVALNRYRLFGKYEQCVLPNPDHDSRFLKDVD